jgi:hypothetical protein
MRQVRVKNLADFFSMCYEITFLFSGKISGFAARKKLTPFGIAPLVLSARLEVGGA